MGGAVVVVLVVDKRDKHGCVKRRYKGPGAGSVIRDNCGKLIQQK